MLLNEHYVLNRLFVFVLSMMCLMTKGLAQTPASSTTRDGASYDIATNTTLGLHNYGTANEVSYDDIDGNPYFMDDFVLGTALLANGMSDDSLMLKYDLVTHTFLSQLEDGSEFSIDSRSVAEYRFYADGEEFLFKRVDARYPRVFYEIIYEGNGMTLFKSADIKVIKGEELGVSKTNDRFFKEVKYYVKKGADISRVKLKKKQLWKYFDVEQQNTLENHIKQHKLKLKSEQDFKNLFSILGE